MSKITPVLNLSIPSINILAVDNNNQQKKKQIIDLLQEIKLFQNKIQQLTALNQQKRKLSNEQKQQTNNKNENNSVEELKQTPPQISNHQNNEQNTLQNIKNQQKQDPFKYQINMLKQQNNLLKQQNDLLKQQTTLKIKITKSDQFIYNQSPISFISQPNNFPIPYQQMSSPPILPNYHSQHFPIPFQQFENQTVHNYYQQNSPVHYQRQQSSPKNFVRSNAQNLFNPPQNHFPSLQSHIHQNSQLSFPILPQSNSKIVRPRSIKRKDAGKILFVKSKHFSEKPHSQGFLSPPYSLDNFQFPQQIHPQTQLKRGILSEPELKHKKESQKTVLSSQQKTKSTSFIRQKVLNGKQKSTQKLIKQDAFDKFNVMKNSLSERKFSNKKQSLSQSRTKNNQKKKDQFELKLQSNSQHKRPVHNQKNKQIREQYNMGRKVQVLEFNTEKEKIDLQNIGFSSTFTEKKQSNIKKAQMNFHNVNVSQLNTFKEFLKLVPKIPSLSSPPSFQNTQQELLLLAKQAFPLFSVHLLQSPQTDLNVKKFKNCVFFGINTHHNILWHYDGKLYYGSWKLNQQSQGQKSGQGFQFYPNKYLFKGQFSHGKRNGQGILHLFNSTTQSIYIGQFVNGKKQGRGKIIDQLGNIYEGQWYDDKRHGLGFYQYANGDIYEGTFAKGEKEGFGVERFSNGDLYRGEYINDKFEGKGLYVWKNTSQYEGEFSSGRRNGQGIWRSSNKNDAEIYQGQYLKDKKDGYGIYRWYNGSYYQGYFRQDKKHGMGKTRYQNGKTAVLEWNEGVSVRKLNRIEWPDFLIDQNQTTVKSEQKQKQSKTKINTFFQYQETPIYQQQNQISQSGYDIYGQETGQISQSRQQSYQTYQNENVTIQQKTFTGQQLRQAKYQPVGSNLNPFNL